MSETTDNVAGLRSLELHYFRFPRERWELMLTRVCQMGADAVSTVVPWTWHEPRDGVFDLTGITHPTRNVTDFLDTCQAMGFRVVLAVRPYAGAGLLGGGVPGWLRWEHPEIRALGPENQPRHDPTGSGPLPSAEHPIYLKFVERWYQELSNVLASWQWPDGPIVALRVDHPDPDDLKLLADETPAHWDYNPHVVEVQWPIWLRQQYDGIDALNSTWQTDYHSVSEVPFPGQAMAPDPYPAPEDAARFVAYAAAHATETYARLLGEMGWTVPIVTDSNTLAGGVELAHACQVDPEPAQLGANVRWTMDAPLRADGYPRQQFWEVKTAVLGAEQGVELFAGGTLVTGAESRRVRLPRPAGDYAVYRLLLDGSLLDASSRRRGDTLYLDYQAADEAGVTDMCLILNDPSAPLSAFLLEYLVSLLMGKASTFKRGAFMCQTLAEAFSGPTAPIRDEAARSSSQGFQVAERSLAEAQRAARRAATSIGRLERLASDIRGEIPSSVPTLLDLSALSARDRERLAPIRDACAQVAPGLKQTAQSITATCQNDEALTVQAYQAAIEEARAAAGEAEAALADSLGRVRADLAAGVLSPTAWTIQDWLTRTLQGLIN